MRVPRWLKPGRTSSAVGALCLAALATAGGASAQAAAPMCIGQAATIVGTEGPDVLTGTPGSDVIVGLGGDDILNGGGEGEATDRICGGDGNDTLNAGQGFVAGLSGDAGDDRIEGGTTLDVFAVFSDAPAPVFVNLKSGSATGWGTDTLDDVAHVIGRDTPTSSSETTSRTTSSAMRAMIGCSAVAGSTTSAAMPETTSWTGAATSTSHLFPVPDPFVLISHEASPRDGAATVSLP
jgi:Ca2+-binding RTX toxin-like protein